MTYHQCTFDGMKLIYSILSLVLGVLLLGSSPIYKDLESSSMKVLFKIERSKDANQIFYDVNLTEQGELSKTNPISIYWLKHTKGGKLEPLTWVQKKYAYGLKFLHVNNNYANFQFVSYNKMNFTLKKTRTNHYEVYTKFNNRLIELKRIYIQLDGGSFWFPKIPEIKIFAKDVKTGEDVLEVISP